MSGSSSKPITVLSIDGGGVKGIIPGVMLQFLESELQKLEGNNPKVRLADYFDVISGTSTGGLIATMISASNNDKERRPLYAAKEIVPFYKKHCPKIFSNSNNRNERKEVVSEESARTIGTFLEGGPWYDGKYLHQLARDILGNRRLHDITLTKLVIPAYDIKHLLPVVFSSFEVEKKKVLDALLSDICISTSAAPVYLPAHKFSNNGQEFNCIDGGVAANNPTLAAITEAVNNRTKEGDKTVDVNDFQLLVLSLGTGANKEAKYDADTANNWWSVNWLLVPIYDLQKGNNPLPEIFSSASSDIVDYYTTTFFKTIGNPENFLRIQDDELPKKLSRLDNGTLENLNELEEYAKNLLNKFAMHADGTNGDALKKFAKKLYDIKHSQDANTKAK